MREQQVKASEPSFQKELEILDKKKNLKDEIENRILEFIKENKLSPQKFTEINKKQSYYEFFQNGNRIKVEKEGPYSSLGEPYYWLYINDTTLGSGGKIYRYFDNLAYNRLQQEELDKLEALLEGL